MAASRTGPVRVSIRTCGSVGSHGPCTAFNNRTGPYVSHTGTVRRFETLTGPALAVMTGYSQFAHGYTTYFCQ